MRDFDTRSPPEPDRLAKLRTSMIAASRRVGTLAAGPLASVVAASRRVSAIAAGPLRSINRHRRAIGLAAFCVVVLAAGIMGFGAYRKATAPEPWPPQYRVEEPEEAGTCPFYNGLQGTCYDVFTDATSKKALTYITKDVANASTTDVEINFYHSYEDGMFAEGSYDSTGYVYID